MVFNKCLNNKMLHVLHTMFYKFNTSGKNDLKKMVGELVEYKEYNKGVFMFNWVNRLAPED